MTGQHHQPLSERDAWALVVKARAESTAYRAGDDPNIRRALLVWQKAFFAEDHELFRRDVRRGVVVPFKAIARRGK